MLAAVQMVKVTNDELCERRGGPIVTRSVAAKVASTQRLSPPEDAPPPPAAAADPSAYTLPPKLPAALDSHNYAKSPIVDVEMTDEEERGAEMMCVDDDGFGEKRVPPAASEVVIGAAGGVTDVTSPLTIQTRFASVPAGPGSSSTDTASEAGSYLASPTASTGLPSPGLATPAKAEAAPPKAEAAPPKAEAAPTKAEATPPAARPDGATKMCIVKRHLDALTGLPSYAIKAPPQPSDVGVPNEPRPVDAATTTELPLLQAAAKSKETKNKFSPKVSCVFVTRLL